MKAVCEGHEIEENENEEYQSFFQYENDWVCAERGGGGVDSWAVAGSSRSG